jgi:two-component system NtrC family sensor kinase
MLSVVENITSSYLILLFYGAIFLFLGVSIAAKNMKGSDLRLASSLWLLGMFGFMHGTHEWIELGILIEGEHLTFLQIFTIKAASILLVFLSFLFLLQFGISLIWGPRHKRIWLFRTIIPAFLLLILTLHVWYFGSHRNAFHIDMQLLRQADIASRYTFGFIGALFTAYGLIVNSRELKRLSRSVSIKLYWASIAFGWYSLFAGILSFSYTLPFLPVPIVVIRGALGMFITYFITKALNIFDIEMRTRYDQQTKSIAQAEKLTSLGRLAAGIAHEINNPLTSASLGIESLKLEGMSGGMDNAMVAKLEAVERNIHKAAVIATNILQFSRQKESTFAQFAIGDAIGGALTLLEYRLKDFTVVQESSVVPKVHGDRCKLEQVFVNVLSNSAEAMLPGGTITIKTAQVKGFVVVTITDRGRGIAKEDLLRVFDPFFTTKEIGQGTGLGLAICFGIAKQHDGTIEISSEEGEGTKVTISIPTGERYGKIDEKNTHCR